MSGFEGGGLTPFKKFEARGWSARAGTYDALMARATAIAIEPLLADVQAGWRLLDVGCGLGTLAAAAAERGARVTGVDLAEGMLEEARRRHPEVSFVRADAEALPFADGEFDLAVGAFLVNHVPDAERAVAEMRRVARRVGLAAWGPEDEVAFLALPARAVSGLGGVPEGPDSERYANPDALAALAGGTVERIVSILKVDDLDELWDGVRGGTVRVAARLEAASAKERARARARLDELAAPYRVAAGFELPVTVLVARGGGPC
jgi:SAM-dependent methyltransferase